MSTMVSQKMYKALYSHKNQTITAKSAIWHSYINNLESIKFPPVIIRTHTGQSKQSAFCHSNWSNLSLKYLKTLYICVGYLVSSLHTV